MKTKNKNNYYLDADELHNEMSKYYFILQKAKKSQLPLPRVPEILGKYVIQLCTQVASKASFNRYSYNEDFIGDAIMNCTYGCSMFDPTKPNANAFNYLTTISIQSFLQRIDKEKKFNFIKHSNFVRNYAGIDGSMLEMAGDANEVSNRIVSEFEIKQAQRKQKQMDKKNKKLKELE